MRPDGRLAYPARYVRPGHLTAAAWNRLVERRRSPGVGLPGAVFCVEAWRARAEKCGLSPGIYPGLSSDRMRIRPSVRCGPLSYRPARSCSAGPGSRSASSGGRGSPGPCSSRPPARSRATIVGSRRVMAARSLFSSVYLSIVCWGLAMVGVGLTARRTTMGWPVVRPPVMPPALFEVEDHLAVRRRASGRCPDSRSCP